MENVEEWENKMADGMMSLEQEAEAFGEEVKPKTEAQNDETTNGDVTEDGKCKKASRKEALVLKGMVKNLR